MGRHLFAFANYSGGGFLVYGVSDEGDVLGIETEKADLFSSQIANWARDLVEPEARTHIFPFEFRDKVLLGVFIEEAFDKPVHLKSGTLEDIYLRAGGHSRQMTRDEIRQSMMSSRHQRFEEMPATLPTQIADVWEQHFDFSEFLKRTRSDSLEQDRINEHLFAHKLLARINGKYHPTNLGVIICAKDFSKLPCPEMGNQA